MRDGQLYSDQTADRIYTDQTPADQNSGGFLSGAVEQAGGETGGGAYGSSHGATAGSYGSAHGATAGHKEGAGQHSDAEQDYAIELDEDLAPFVDVDAVRFLAAQVGLSPEQAQVMARIGAEAAVENQHRQEAWLQQMIERQISETKAELHAEWGDAMVENVRMASRAVRHYGGEELEALFAETGLLNNPVVIRAFHKAGQGLTEDSAPGYSGPGRPRASLADRLYPTRNEEG
ncbi:hypothetical protein [Kiloniella sp. b19]|uniref:hypothetical protein n=1 Tax=Kiloniella sp. GXU_MW_B19 TaxID=3141326 RepID=UPI0031D3CC35